MSTTTTTTASTSTIRVALFPAPPPTNNTLDPEQRSRLLRSTRKLGAVLGTTPFLLESDSDAEGIAPALPSPHTIATRREGRIFHSPSSSVSSLDSLEPEYVFVKSSTRSVPYQVQAVPPLSLSTYSTPSSSRSASPMPICQDNTVKKYKGPPASARAPIAVTMETPGSRARSGAVVGAKRGKGPQALAQPLLLRLRSVPFHPSDTRIKSATMTSFKSPNFPLVETIPSSKPPLSPVASTFNMNMDASTNASTSNHVSSLTDREKRRKMAKLTRTLGENVPPELVFRTTPPTATTETLNRRTPSLSVSRPRMADIFTHKSSKSVVSAALPPLAVAEAPMPPRESLEQTTTATTTAPSKLRRRPRSLTHGTSQAVAAANPTMATRGTTSLDAQPPVEMHKMQEQPFAALNPSQQQRDLGVMDGGRRKEREWSGEWNLKNMDEVAKALRRL